VILNLHIDDERCFAAPLNDRALGCAELGLLLWLLSREDGSRAHYRLIGYRFGCGPDRMRTLLKRLAAAGYVQADHNARLLNVYARPVVERPQ
jgi:hypothetical protein